MIIDLKRTVIKIQISRFITLIVLVIFLLILMIMLDYKQIYFGLSKYQWSIVVAGIYVIYVIYQGILEPYYIYFSDQGEKIILRYFSMSFYNDKKHTIEIPKESFSGFEIKSSLAGLKKKLILCERIKNTDAKYPAVSITALSKTQQNNLIAALERDKVVSY